MIVYQPGPWIVDPKYPLDVIQDGEIVVAGCRSETEARIIAAAPRTLKALERLFNATNNPEFQSMHEARDEASAAIRQAKGDPT